jgi:hypothetical protein
MSGRVDPVRRLSTHIAPLSARSSARRNGHETLKAATIIHEGEGATPTR